jgi:hypothetical protein
MPVHTFRVISYDKRMNDFMVSCDVFEKGKVLGEIIEIVVNTNSEYSDEDAINKMRRAVEAGGHIVSFVALEHSKAIPYFNPEVRVVSNGKEFFMLHEYIKSQYPYLDVETDNQYFITGIKLK